MKGTLLTALARTSIGAIAIATTLPGLAHAADEQAAATATAAAQVASPAPSDAAVAAEDQTATKDIVVTGTQIRGSTPAGATLLTTTAEAAAERGATTGNEILSQLPQASNFFQSLPALGGGAAGLVAVSRLPFQPVSLRNLPNVNTGGSPTLTLIDGHRVVPMGTNALGGQGVDSSGIMATTLQRTEVMPDGGSAIYGSDAIAGVINYITRDSFDGLQLQARGGLAGKYKQFDANIIAGTKWSTGSVFAAFAYNYHDHLDGRDRDYIHAIDANPLSPLYGTPLGLNCFAPNISITSTVAGVSSRRLYPLTAPGGTIQPFTTNGGTNGNGTTTNGIAGGNRCDTTDNNSYYPKSKEINALVGLKQELTDNLTFSLKANYLWHKTTADLAANLTATVASNNLNYRPVCTTNGAGGTPTCGVTPGFFATDATASQSVLTDYSSIFGPSIHSYVFSKLWQATPQLSWDFAKDWEVRGLVSYGESKSTGIQGAVDPTASAARVLSGLINPYNLSASGAGAFTSLITYSATIGEFHMLDARVVADGPLPLITLPAGPIKMAIGAEYTRTTLISSATGSVLSPTPNRFLLNQQNPGGVPLRYTQSVKSVFAEADIPLIDEDMHIPLISSFTINASGRYDKYNDFGGTANPNIGATWAVVPWFKINGNWNTSFAAPTNYVELGTFTGAQFNNSTCNAPAGGLCGSATGGTSPGNIALPYLPTFIAPGGANAGQPGLPNQGAQNQSNPTGIGASLTNATVKGIKPQTSKSWSLGFEMAPPFLPGLSFGMSFYKLNVAGLIAAPLAPDPQSIFNFHPELVNCHGGVTAAAANAAQACAVPMSIAELTAAGYLSASDPLTGGGGLATAASLTNAGLAGSGSQVAWPTVLANYCGPPGAPGPAGTFTGPGTCTPVTPGANTYTVFYVFDNRSRNLGLVFATGIDFHAAYKTNVPWGSLDANVQGTINLSTHGQAGAGQPKTDLQLTSSIFRLNSTLGTNWGGFRAQLTWQHSAGQNIAVTSVGTIGTAVIPGTLQYGQTRVGAYDTFDLFLRYKFDDLGGEHSAFKGLELTLNVNNIANTPPPVSGGGFANGLTLGRMFQLGITKAF